MLGFLGSTDLGALAATSLEHRRLVVKHLLTTPKIFIDFDTAERRGCAVRGIRMLRGYLRTVVHIHAQEGLSDLALRSDSAQIERAVAVIVRTNSRTLRAVWADFADLSSSILEATSECKWLAFLSARDPTPEESVRVSNLVHAAIANNSSCMTTVKTWMRPDTLALALARLPLERVGLTCQPGYDLQLLGECATIVHLDLCCNPISHPPAWIRFCNDLARALPKLTRLVVFELETARIPSAVALPDLSEWRFAASVRDVEVKSYSDTERLPAMSGSGVAQLDLHWCSAAVFLSMLRGFRALERVEARSLFEFGRRRNILGPAILGGLMGGFSSLTSLTMADTRAGGMFFASIGLGAEAIATLVRACSSLRHLHVVVNSSFGVGGLADLLTVSADRLRTLRLSYSAESKIELARQSSPSAQTPLLTSSYSSMPSLLVSPSSSAALGQSAAPRILLLYLEHLEVSMCDDALLERIACPRLSTLIVMGARAEIGDLDYTLSAFPLLTTLGLSVTRRSTSRARYCFSGKPRELARIRRLTLSWRPTDHADEDAFGTHSQHDRDSKYIKGVHKSPNPCGYTGIYIATGFAQLLRSSLVHLTLAGHTFADQSRKALVDDQPSVIETMRIHDTCTAWRSDSALVGGQAAAFKKAHPRLTRLVLPREMVDGRLRSGLAGIELEPSDLWRPSSYHPIVPPSY